MTRRRRSAFRPRGGALAGWTIQRASMAGIACGLLALIMSAFVGSDLSFKLYAVLLALTLFCGASILWITLQDVRSRARGDSVRPIRIFDVAIGAALTLPAVYGLHLVWPYLGL